MSNLPPGRLTRRAVLLATASALVATGFSPVFLHPAAGQVVVVPTTRVFHVVGHGWGHGHGLSQDGAYGAAAVDHLTASQIVSFYYPHTAAGSIGNPTMRILLQSTAANYVVLGEPAGTGAVLSIHDLASNYRADLPATPTMWRFIAGTSSITIQDYVSGAWHAFAPGGHASFAGPMNIGQKNASSSAPMRVIYPSGTERDYRGYLQAVRAAANNVDAMAVMPMEDYLRGSVPRESPSSWPAAALQAQAIAARSYAEYEREHAGSSDHDICDSTDCQVFGGTTEVSAGGTVTLLEASSTNSAIAATAGQVRTYGGKAIFAQYSADDGGWTTDGGAPYLIAQPDPYDAHSHLSSYSWSAALPASALESAYPSIGTLRSIRVTQRDGNGEWDGRVVEAQLVGSSATVTVSGHDVSSAYSWPTHSNGLRSAWWELVPTPVADFTGNASTDVSVWRGSQGNWYDAGNGGVHLGQQGDIPVAGDYDGDGTVERAVWRPASGRWYVEGQSSSTQYGESGDIPVPADYNGDGRTDFAVFRPSEDRWYVHGMSSVVWGHRTDVPVPGDYNGDGRADLAVWRPSTGTWYVRGSSQSRRFGQRGDVPVPGDYRGTGDTQVAIWRPGNGRWYVDDGRGSYRFGTKGDVPVPGDYDGNAIAQAAVYRPSTATWYIHGLHSTRYGVATDQPLPLPSAIYRAR
ncbi:MAG: SpoIID/LytB domain-containing protein [Actinomycetes bacterium]